MKKQTKKIALGLSGGVDSAVAAYLLKQQGYDVTCIFLKVYEPDDAYTDECSWKEDMESAQAVAHTLDLPFESWNFERVYQESVLSYFFHELQVGRTPNPDTLCNKDVKFGVFLEKALAKGFDAVATGHYAAIQKEGSTYTILRGADHEKDQSYFLSRVPQAVLPHIRFPLGERKKSEVRKIAKSVGLPNAERKDSQGICFLGGIDVREFIKRHMQLTPGKIKTTTGETIGTHQGLPLYTIGQREGIGIGGTKEPYYVIGKNLEENSLIVAEGKDRRELYSHRCALESVCWYDKQALDSGHCEAVIRYRQKPQNACVLEINKRWTVTFKEKQRAITPGQICAFYVGRMLVGSGIIASVIAKD